MENFEEFLMRELENGNLAFVPSISEDLAWDLNFIMLKDFRKKVEKAIDKDRFIVQYSTIPNSNFATLHLKISTEEKYEIKKASDKIISEIFNDTSSQIEMSDETAIITLSPINDKVLKYLSENPEAWYQLTDSDFELAMAEIYNKLGYKVERTQTTRDGGKDIIIRKPEILGDFIYYVECKKYAPKRPIGVGIMRNLVGTINTDRVNSGILATTSYFTKPARDFILNNNLSYRIKTHDYNTIQQLLNTVV